MILEYNPEIKNYYDVEPGQNIKIPNYYAKQIIIYLEKERKIPVYIKTYDYKGLFEEYRLEDIILNPVFLKDEFTKDFKNYGF